MIFPYCIVMCSKLSCFIPPHVASRSIALCNFCAAFLSYRSFYLHSMVLVVRFRFPPSPVSITLLSYASQVFVAAGSSSSCGCIGFCGDLGRSWRYDRLPRWPAGDERSISTAPFEHGRCSPEAEKCDGSSSQAGCWWSWGQWIYGKKAARALVQSGGLDSETWARFFSWLNYAIHSLAPGLAIKEILLPA